MNNGPKYGIIGDGRVATHTAHFLGLLGLSFTQWSRKQGEALRPEAALSDCGVLLVLISDSAIESFLRDHPVLASKQCVHFSGALVTPLAYGAHPLMTFPKDRLYDRAQYERVSWVCEEPNRFAELFPALPNSSFGLTSEKRALYHALCVSGGNFTTLLWQEVFDLFEKKLGLPREAATAFLGATVENLIADAPKALTGPLVRGDAATIQKNLEALAIDGGELREVYSAFIRLYEHRKRRSEHAERS